MLCDDWPGLEDCFEAEREILVVRCAEDVVKALNLYDATTRNQIGAAFRARALRNHTYAQRAQLVERIFTECLDVSTVATANSAA